MAKIEYFGIYQILMQTDSESLRNPLLRLYLTVLRSERKVEKGLHITDQEIIFVERPLGEISSTCWGPSYKIKIDDIKIISVSPRLSMDDEVLIISMIDRYKNIYYFSSREFGNESVIKFEKIFELESLVKFSWEKFSWEDHQNYITDKIIFPKELYWNDLFLKPKFILKFWIQLLKFLELKKNVSGVFTSEVEKYLNEIKNA